MTLRAMRTATDTPRNYVHRRFGIAPSADADPVPTRRFAPGSVTKIGYGYAASRCPEVS